MALVDIIHQGETLFTEKQFSLLNFSFTGDLFLDGICLVDNIHFEGNYGITGIIELTMHCNIKIECTKDENFLYYTIKGYDDIYTYNIERIFFTSGPSIPIKFIKGIYNGTINSDIVISKKRKIGN